MATATTTTEAATTRRPEPSRFGWPGRLVAAGLALAIAVPATAVQLDRQSRLQPSIAGHVPAFARRFAAAVLASQELSDNRNETAYAEARQLVARRPVPAENLALLAVADLRHGDTAQATQAFTIASRRSWREVFSQRFVIASALATGQWSIAADRLIALWSANLGDPQIDDVTREVLAHPQGQVTFGKRLAAKPRWMNTFLQWGAANMSPAPLATTIRAAIDNGGAFDCKVLANRALLVARSGHAADAARMWAGPCVAQVGATGPGYAFYAPQDPTVTGPLDWQYFSYASFVVRFLGEDDRHRISYTNGDPITRTLAARVTMLAPGAHSMTLTRSPGSSGHVYVRMDCIDEKGNTSLLVGDMNTGAPIAFTVPASGCGAQQLVLKADRGSDDGLAFAMQ